MADDAQSGFKFTHRATAATSRNIEMTSSKVLSEVRSPNKSLHFELATDYVYRLQVCLPLSTTTIRATRITCRPFSRRLKTFWRMEQRRIFQPVAHRENAPGTSLMNGTLPKVATFYYTNGGGRESQLPEAIPLLQNTFRYLMAVNLRMSRIAPVRLDLKMLSKMRRSRWLHRSRQGLQASHHRHHQLNPPHSSCRPRQRTRRNPHIQFAQSVRPIHEHLL